MKENKFAIFAAIILLFILIGLLVQRAHYRKQVNDLEKQAVFMHKSIDSLQNEIFAEKDSLGNLHAKYLTVTATNLELIANAAKNSGRLKSKDDLISSLKYKLSIQKTDTVKTIVEKIISGVDTFEVYIGGDSTEFVEWYVEASKDSIIHDFRVNILTDILTYTEKYGLFKHRKRVVTDVLTNNPFVTDQKLAHIVKEQYVPRWSISVGIGVGVNQNLSPGVYPVVVFGKPLISW